MTEAERKLLCRAADANFAPIRVRGAEKRTATRLYKRRLLQLGEVWAPGTYAITDEGMAVLAEQEGRADG